MQLQYIYIYTVAIILVCSLSTSAFANSIFDDVFSDPSVDTQAGTGLSITDKQKISNQMKRILTIGDLKSFPSPIKVEYINGTVETYKIKVIPNKPIFFEITKNNRISVSCGSEMKFRGKFLINSNLITGVNFIVLDEENNNKIIIPKEDELEIVINITRDLTLCTDIRAYQ